MRPTPWLVWAGALALGALWASSAGAQDVARGEELFALCSQCHGANGEGSAPALAPAIAGLEAWYVEAQLGKFRDGVRATHFDDLAGMRMRPMAKWLKSDQDVKAAAAYVASLAPTRPAPTLAGGDPAKGAAVYPVCAGCHGAAGEGVKDVNGPSLTRVSDWYLLTQLKNFKQGIRGSDPRDVTGGAMRPMAMILADEQAMKDVIAHIGTLAAASGGSE
jgi:cytochrome c553